MPTEAKTPMASLATKPFEAKNYEKLIGMAGFSEKLLTTHFKLYQGYVANTNTLLEQFRTLSAEGKDKTPAFAEGKRRFGWEWNGMRLHEYYFDNLGGKAALPEARIQSLISENFGDFETWKKDFVATGAMRGIGWVILYQDAQTGKLFNSWIEEHQTNHLAGGEPLLVMDVFEHAFIIDYGTDRAAYITAFFNNVDWDVVESRVR